MKKILSLYTKEMIHPILYKCVQKCVLALTVILLWNRYINHGQLSWMRDGGFAAGLVFLVLAWIAYLRLDGIQFPFSTPGRKKRKHWGTADMVDFVDEHIVTFDELQDDEQLACFLASNLLSGVSFLILSLAGMIWG